VPSFDSARTGASIHSSTSSAGTSLNSAVAG
jgi:hypothetical protein